MTEVSLSPADLTNWIQQVGATIDKGVADKADAATDFARVLQSATDAMEPAPTTAGPGADASALAANALAAQTITGGGPAPTVGGSALDGTALTDTTTVNGTTPTTGTDVVTDAEKYLGVPYVWGGTDPATGLDCSGLTQRVYEDLGYQLPRTAAEQAAVGQPVASTSSLQAGDLLFFGSPAHHVVIYAGDNAAGVPQIIEAPHTGEDVRRTSLAAAISADGEPSAMRRILGDTALMFNTGTSGSSPAATAGVAADAIGGRTAPASAAASSTPYASAFAAAAAATGVPARLLEAVAQQESGLRANATSPAGAEGIMQLMPSTAASLGVSDPYNAQQSIEGGATYLHRLLTEFGGNTTLALAAYNAGPGAVTKYGGVPPYAETQNYVKSVESLMGAES